MGFAESSSHVGGRRKLLHGSGGRDEGKGAMKYRVDCAPAKIIIDVTADVVRETNITSSETRATSYVRRPVWSARNVEDDNAGRGTIVQFVPSSSRRKRAKINAKMTTDKARRADGKLCIPPEASSSFSDARLMSGDTKQNVSNSRSPSHTRISNHGKSARGARPSSEFARSAASATVRPQPILTPVRGEAYDADSVEEEVLAFPQDIRTLSLSVAEEVHFEKLTKDEDVHLNFEGSAIVLAHKDMELLRGVNWLNDEVMNVGVHLVNRRNKSHFRVQMIAEGCGWQGLAANDEVVEVPVTFGGIGDLSSNTGRPLVHMFNTFFYSRLVTPSPAGTKYDYGGVWRWTEKADVLVSRLDMVLVPINLGLMHWVLAVFDMKARAIFSFDSMKGRPSEELIIYLREWLKDELLTYEGAEYVANQDIPSWRTVLNPGFMPVQTDPGSCGMFVILLADFLELGRRPTYTNEQMPTLRKRMALFFDDGKLPSQ